MTDEQTTPSLDQNRRRLALFAGGGSAGHVFPGLAVAEVLVERGWTVMWTGRPEGMERTLVEAECIGYAPLAAAPLVGQGVLGKLKALGLLAASSWRGRRLVRRLAAGVVIGTGGYVSAPAVLGARLAGRPSLLLEPNARAGAANRLLSRWAAAAAVAFADTAGDLSCRAEATGTPVRRRFFDQAARPAGASLALLVLGGSQGARQINELLPPALAGLAGRLPALSVCHQAGAAHAETVRADYAGRDLGAIAVEVVPFLADMPSALGAADLVISRAGAITLAELCAAGRPSILVPLRQAADHQLDNASRLEAAGSAVVLADASAAVASLSAALHTLLTDPARLAAMGRAARAQAAADAASRIADLVDQLEEAA
jgi:UDP-N-acetylglucosamine--N-acetylmuramyl-(pentapeptide) pyrophosphoryl-undecaprenol N-acetylglucosamine transferase